MPLNKLCCILFHIAFYLCMCTHTFKHTPVELRGLLLEVSSLLSSCGFWGCWQASTQSSPWLSRLTFYMLLFQLEKVSNVNSTVGNWMGVHSYSVPISESYCWTSRPLGRTGCGMSTSAIDCFSNGFIHHIRRGIWKGINWPHKRVKLWGHLIPSRSGGTLGTQVQPLTCAHCVTLSWHLGAAVAA